GGAQHHLPRRRRGGRLRDRRRRQPHGQRHPRRPGRRGRRCGGDPRVHDRRRSSGRPGVGRDQRRARGCPRDRGPRGGRGRAGGGAGRGGCAAGVDAVSGPDRRPAPAPAARGYRAKRALDLAVLAVLAVPALAVAAVCALAVRLTSRGPILFRQTRVGQGERPFELLKFRTMVDRPDNPLFPDDDRITSAGRWLRRTSLDELPQLWNVVRGEMSIVGPRPAMPYQVELLDDRQRGRFRAKPGLTGLAQVRGRNEIPWAERIEHDLEYLERCSLGLDLWCLARTPLTLLGGAGGHVEDDPLTRDTTIDEL